MAKEASASEDPKAKTDAAPPAPTKSSLQKKILMFGIPIFLVQAAAVYFLTAKILYPASVRHSGGTVQEEAKPEPEPESQIYVVKDLIVNPAGTKGTRFLLTTIGIEVASPAAKAELEKKDVQVRDILNSILSGKELDELVDGQKRKNLRKEIADQVKKMVPDDQLRNVYFSKFIIQ
ncbi:MAG TPA: flagellar basal body-associated FliL family protein [Bacteroidota bacterium]|nr:flagellar basal body-associated FliL family protein [Bacteroidota bacterium]